MLDRRSIISRHNPVLTGLDPSDVLQVGNGEFAFGVDVTGLQTFYGNTFSQWGWHSCFAPSELSEDELTLEMYDTYGRQVGYHSTAEGQEELYRRLRENPHRLNLGRIGFKLDAGDGMPPGADTLSGIRQELILWEGLIESEFSLGDIPIHVSTCVHPDLDAVAVRVTTQSGTASPPVEIAFPYGAPVADGADWESGGKHETQIIESVESSARFSRRLDEDSYSVALRWSGNAELVATGPHSFLLRPTRDEDKIEFVCVFSPNTGIDPLPEYSEVKGAAARYWVSFWSSGGAVDLSDSRAQGWKELERRTILSQYALMVNEAGSLPPQESGLLCNTWYGKFHLEMHWWHGTHYALWNRWPLLERSLHYYHDILGSSRERAKEQGYRGARWPKMVGPEGRDSPSGVAPLLIWQQVHPIYYAELDYRRSPSGATLEKWSDIVFDSAEFMVSYAVLNEDTGYYVLGPPLIPVCENTKARDTMNPAFELSYWRFGLRIAQSWRERLGKDRNLEWDQVLRALAPLPQKDGLYLMKEGLEDTYTTMNWEHPALTGAYGMLPGDGVDPVVMSTSVKKILQVWEWDRCWGWDFPMVAMAAAKTGQPDLAIEALLHPSPKNQYGASGVCRGGPEGAYFPGNGGLLFAIALMAAGWDRESEERALRDAPGFPDDGNWKVRWEGLTPAL